MKITQEKYTGALLRLLLGCSEEHSETITVGRRRDMSIFALGVKSYHVAHLAIGCYKYQLLPQPRLGEQFFREPRLRSGSP